MKNKSDGRNNFGKKSISVNKFFETGFVLHYIFQKKSFKYSFVLALLNIV